MGEAPSLDGSVAAIVLAAGRSSRMGAHKLLLPLGGEPLVAHAVRAACESLASPVIVVLGHDAQHVRAALPAGNYTVVENPAFAAGMASSLRAGLAAVPESCAGALITLGDQPLISAQLLNRLIDASSRSPERIVAAGYDGRRGNPVRFPRRYFTELAAITGDEGGRSVLQRHPDALLSVECGDLAPALDADTPADYARIQREWEARHGASGSGGAPS